MSLLTELSESKMYPTESKLDREKHDALTDNAHMIFMALHILLCEDSTEDWAEKYVKKTLRGDFRTWRSDATDLYAILYGLNTGRYNEGSYRTFSLGAIKRWLTHVQDMDKAEGAVTRVFFTRLDGMLDIKDGALKSIRRMVMDWEMLDNRERRVSFTRLLHLMRRKTPKAEVLVKLESLARTRNYELEEEVSVETGEVKSRFSLLTSLLGDSEGVKAARALEKLKETATAGGTSAASIATVTKPLGGETLGAGFDSNGHKGIYQGAKPLVLRRGDPPKKGKN